MMGRKGLALPLTLIAVVIMGMMASLALKVASDEFHAARANRLGYLELVGDEAAINWALGTYAGAMDSLIKLSVPGLPLQLDRGVQMVRYSQDPEIATDPNGDMVMLHTQQVVAFKRGQVEVTLHGNPGMWVPGDTDDDPNPDHDPNETAWKCIWPNESHCWSSPNFGAHWLGSHWELAPRSWRQKW